MWFWLAAAWAGCPDDPASDLRARATALDKAYEDVDETGFAEHYAALQGLVPCLTSELDARTILAWHKARALGEFFEREEIASAKSWAAVKVLDPAWAPPESWIVEGTPLQRAWAEAPASDARIELERSPEGGWKVDGTRATSVPADRAFVLQGFDSAGSVVHTDYHYSVAEVPVVDFEALDATARERRRKRMRRYGSALAGVLGAGAVGTLTAAWTQERAVQSYDTPLEDVPVHAQRANALSGVGIGLGVAGAGVATTAWVVRW
ncbi:MAG: hypothetical protein H6737_18000 [Alphaproteobacteria bacterium]|nr:hypothetical protein [Alphaproteobacteria bacterium]